MSDTSGPDFLFHWEGGSTEWDQLRVVSLRVEDALSSPYEVKLVLRAKTTEDEIDPETMVGQLATLRIATLSEPAVRCLHGLIIEASEIGATRNGMLYEVILAPPVIRAAHRVGCRIFLEKSTREIIEAVLTTDPKMKPDDPEFEAPDSITDAFEPPTESFAFRVADPARIEDKKTRPYCVQYNESNLQFVARLLAEEGIAYHFEHHAKAIVMVLSDSDEGRTKLEPFDPVAPGALGRQLDQIRLGGRMRATKFRLTDYNWTKPKLDMKAEAKADGDESLAVDHYPGLYPDEPKQGELLVKARLERLQTEARFAEIDTGCRLLGAGTVFAVAHPTPRYEGEYLAVRVILTGHVLGELGAGEGVPAVRASHQTSAPSARASSARVAAPGTRPRSRSIGPPCRSSRASSVLRRQWWRPSLRRRAPRSTSEAPRATRTAACASSFTGIWKPSATTRSLPLAGCGSRKPLQGQAVARFRTRVSAPR